MAAINYSPIVERWEVQFDGKRVAEIKQVDGYFVVYWGLFGIRQHWANTLASAQDWIAENQDEIRAVGRKEGKADGTS